MLKSKIIGIANEELERLAFKFKDEKVKQFQESNSGKIFSRYIMAIMVAKLTDNISIDNWDYDLNLLMDYGCYGDVYREVLELEESNYIFNN